MFEAYRTFLSSPAPLKPGQGLGYEQSRTIPWEENQAIPFQIENSKDAGAAEPQISVFPHLLQTVTPLALPTVFTKHLDPSNFHPAPTTSPQQAYPTRASGNLRTSQTPTPPTQSPHCPESALSRSIFLVVKTGATVIDSRLPKHFETTLRCVPNHAIFSDFEEDISRVPVHDVLDEVPPKLKLEDEDFEMYRRMQIGGREALRPSEKAESTDGPGWRLDKVL